MHVKVLQGASIYFTWYALKFVSLKWEWFKMIHYCFLQLSSNIHTTQPISLLITCKVCSDWWQRPETREFRTPQGMNA